MKFITLVPVKLWHQMQLQLLESINQIFGSELMTSNSMDRKEKFFVCLYFMPRMLIFPLSILKMYFRYVFDSSSVSIKNENWAQSPTVQPDNLSKFEHCVHIYGTDGFWYDELCNIKKYFVCEDMNNDILFWRTCPLTWDLINKKCYHKASSNTVS